MTGFATMFCGFLVPAWSDRVGRKPAMVIFCFMGIVTALAALYFEGPMWVLGLLLFIGWSGTGAFPIFMGVVPGETVPKALTASSMGLVVCIGEFSFFRSTSTQAGSRRHRERRIPHSGH